MTAVKLFRNRRGERTFRRLEEGSAISLQETVDDLIIIGFSGVFDGDVVINGDLTVNGTQTTINSTVHVIADNKIVINDGETGAGVVTLGTKAGLTVDRGSEADVEWCWDETRDIWTSFGELFGDVADPTSGIHVGDRDFNDARYLLVVNDLSDLESATNARVNLGLEIGVDVAAQAHVGAGGAAHSNATAEGAAGFMSSSDKSKLDGIEPFAKDDQDLWLTVAGDSGSTLASNSTKTLTIAGAGLISTAMSGDTLTVSTTATSNPSALDNIVEDGTPQLGANLDLNLFDFVEDGNVILSFESAGELAVNWVDVENALTGLGPTIRSVGADTNIDLNISAKGTGIVNLGSGGVKLNANLDVNGNSIITSGNVVLSFASFSESAVNWADIENADTGLGPTITAKGPDSNIDLNLTAKGLGRVNVTNDSAVAGAFVNDALDTLDVAVTTIQGLHYLGAFTVAGLPAPAGATNRLALATNAGGGRSLVISDGSDWKVFAVEGAIVTTA